MAKITLLMASWCPDCHRAIEWLDKNDVKYEKIDIQENPEWAQKLEDKTGKRGIPYFIINGKWIKGYVPGKTFDANLIKEFI